MRGENHPTAPTLPQIEHGRNRAMVAVSVTWADLEGENAFVVMGTLSHLFIDLMREVGDPTIAEVAANYRERAMSGDYEHLLDVSHEYAHRYFQDTLAVPETRA